MKRTYRSIDRLYSALVEPAHRRLETGGRNAARRESAEHRRHHPPRRSVGRAHASSSRRLPGGVYAAQRIPADVVERPAIEQWSSLLEEPPRVPREKFFWESSQA